MGIGLTRDKAFNNYGDSKRTTGQKYKQNSWEQSSWPLCSH